MKQLILAAALLAGWTLSSSAPALAKNYDCSKPGNANKAACKNAAKTATTAAAKPAKAAPSKPAASKASTTTAKSVTERKYDCSKAGNANKKECKAAAASNQSVSKSVAAAKPAPAAKASPAAAPTMAGSSKAADDHNPAGAIAQCKDGTYSHAKSHSGACSHHGGVAKWS